MFCSKCGSQIDDDSVFCPECGNQVSGSNFTTGNAQGEYNQSDSYQQSYQDSYQQSAQEYTTDPDSGMSFSKEDIDNNKMIALLSYIGILFIIPLLVAKESPYARYHINQGIVLFIFEAICAAVFSIPLLGWIVGGVGEIICVVLLIIGILNVLNGSAKPLPIIGKFTILK